ncbi:C45 family autoproteolytic acyltransferase/hydolase [Allokutzneria albata]|uniref:Acyl-coenzyme A:6-aminopenicillanic acid acyl-transferase n=1 Tax=Allokutzneria albata TaxID=211114 RepID=A0A1H0D0U1_ALLAB|nr:C45 family peptidase [Allokutzneria albata]SDN63666.1 Acyl-coenzyme A:6-aminopenicillanic acid acyl-transferase [Allokutzneria albata]
MAVLIDHHELGGMPWVVVRGERHAAFRALGAEFAERVRALVLGMPELAGMRRYEATGAGAQELSELIRLTERGAPQQYAELAELAKGADIPLRTLLLANLRGDVPNDVSTAGCSDVLWRGRRSVLAHNEDGAVGQDEQLVLLTLRLEDEPAVTALWYPGFLPGNAFVVTGLGMVFGLDHIPLVRPKPGIGRHFVARALHGVRGVEDVVRFLGRNPSAGGFAYNVGDLETGRLLQVESASGDIAMHEPDATKPWAWHTNHLRYLTEQPDRASASSVARAQALTRLSPPKTDPRAEWFLDVLTRPTPRGVYRDPVPGDQSATLCSFVADLSAREVTVALRGGTPATVSVDRLLSGP